MCEDNKWDEQTKQKKKWRVPPLEVSAQSSSWTGLAGALTCSFSSVICGQGVPPQASLASRKERTCKNCERGGPSPKDSFLPGAFGLHGPNVNHYEGPSVMADLIDRTLVKVSCEGILMVGICDRRLTVSTYPVLHMQLLNNIKVRPTSIILQQQQVYV